MAEIDKLLALAEKANEGSKLLSKTALISKKLEGSLFKEQLDFMKMKRSKKLAVCSRRAGKTNLASKWMVLRALETPGVLIPYITLSIKNAKRIIWPMLQELEREFDIGMEFKRTELTVILPNRSQIWLCGLAEPDDADKLRGPRYPLCILDECQSMRSYLEATIEDVLEPATLDYGLEASIVMFGTPNAACAGYFYEASRFSKGWGKAHWTMLDNPHLPHAKDWIEKKISENGWEQDTPILRREYYGEWVRDEDSVVYGFERARDSVIENFQDHKECRLFLGVDLGYEDPSAFVVLGYKPDEKAVFVFEAYQKSKMITDDIANEILNLREKYKHRNREHTFDKIVVDSGGLGKMITQELNRRYSLGLMAAEKNNKLEFINLMNADFKLGRIKINYQEARVLCEQYELLEWNPNHLEKGRYIELGSCENHCSDAALYAWRECYHYLSVKEESVIKYSGQWYEKLENEMEAEAEAGTTGDKAFWEEGFVDS